MFAKGALDLLPSTLTSLTLYNVQLVVVPKRILRNDLRVTLDSGFNHIKRVYAGDFYAGSGLAGLDISNNPHIEY